MYTRVEFTDKDLHNSTALLRRIIFHPNLRLTNRDTGDLNSSAMASPPNDHDDDDNGDDDNDDVDDHGDNVYLRLQQDVPKKLSSV
jgi:hypothetical protein